MYAIRSYYGTDRIRERCLTAGAWLYYPRMSEDGNLTFFRHEENDGWERGRFGIREPRIVPGREGIRKGFDLVVVPGLAFDAAGRRLGQGHGYYVITSYSIHYTKLYEPVPAGMPSSSRARS